MGAACCAESRPSVPENQDHKAIRAAEPVDQKEDQSNRDEFISNRSFINDFRSPQKEVRIDDSEI